MKNPVADRKRKTVVLKGIGGLGNRIEAFAEAVIYAHLTGRKLIVDWTDGMYADKGVNAFHVFFRSPDVDADARIPDEGSVRPAIWEDHRTHSVRDVMAAVGLTWDMEHVGEKVVALTSADVRDTAYGEDVLMLMAWNYNYGRFRPHRRRIAQRWGPARGDALLGRVLRESLCLRDGIRGRVQDFASHAFAARPVIGVHVRQTDNMRLTAQAIDAARLMERAASIRVRTRDAAIFLATDSLAVREAWQRRFVDVLSVEKEFPAAPGMGLHAIERKVDRARMTADALTDLYLLARCDHLVYSSRSSFGRIASLLSDAPRRRLCDVDRPSRLRRFMQRFARAAAVSANVCRRRAGSLVRRVLRGEPNPRRAPQTDGLAR